MQRKTKKVILLIFGFAAAAVFIGIFVENMLNFELVSWNYWIWFTMRMSTIVLLGFIPICISMRMHAKDIMTENEQLSKLLNFTSVLLILIGVFALTLGPMIFSTFI